MMGRLTRDGGLRGSGCGWLLGALVLGLAGAGCDALADEVPAPGHPELTQVPSGPFADLPPREALVDLPDSVRRQCEVLLSERSDEDDFRLMAPPPDLGIVGAPPPSDLEALSVPERRAKPISGGTLLVTHDRRYAVAADPERDAVYVVDLESHAVLHSVQLEMDAEPGRAIEDADGRVHVVLRGAGDVVSLDPETGAELGRRSVCENGRGLAYREEDDSLWVACLEGALGQLSADPGEADMAMRTDVPVGAHDVVVDGDGHVLVSLFRSAEVVDLGRDPMAGAPVSDAPRWAPGEGRYASAFGSSPCRVERFSASVAFRTLGMADGSIGMVHERSKRGTVETAPGAVGYGGSSGSDNHMCGSSIVQSVVTIKRPGQAPRSAVLHGAVLPVDAAFSPDGDQLAVVAPANRYSPVPQLQVIGRLRFGERAIDPAATVVTSDNPHDGCMADGIFEFGAAPDLSGQLTAVAFVETDRMVVQSREPALLHLIEQSEREGRVVVDTISLSDVSVLDTGHTMFHMDAGAGIACASCHPDGGDDAHTWDFAELGPRRTQHLRGGLLGSEPFHWQGDMESFEALYHEVFVGRMGGFLAPSDDIAALASWIDSLPAYRKPVTDALAVARGEAVFHSDEAACATCHAGEQLRINVSQDVGTGQPFQVPSLTGIAFHAPYMHDGCAPGLVDRFSECGGAEHGNTAHLDSQQVDDLVTYLESL